MTHGDVIGPCAHSLVASRSSSFKITTTWRSAWSNERTHFSSKNEKRWILVVMGWFKTIRFARTALAARLKIARAEYLN